MKRNLFSNFSAKILIFCITAILTSYFIKRLGIESYGLIGIFYLLVTLSSLFDAGLSVTINREMTRFCNIEHEKAELNGFVKTIELIYWLIAIAFGAAIIGASSYLSLNWVKSLEVTNETARACLALMGIALAFQLPTSLYSAAFLGLQKHVLCNAILLVMNILRAISVIFVFEYIDCSTASFFLCQIFISVVQTLVLRYFVWRTIGGGYFQAKFKLAYVKRIAKFTLGAGGIGILSVIIANLDKIILSKKLSLDIYGYYALAANFASSLYFIISPLFVTYFPRFTELVVKNDENKIKELYHYSCRFMSTLIFPVAFVLIFFSYDILLIWTANAQVAENTYLIAACLTSGTLLNGLMNFPFALQLAIGWTQLVIIQNIISIVVLVPTLFLVIKIWGAAGAATVWVIHNAACILISLPLIHRKVLKGELIRWYRQDVLKPLLITMGVVVAFKWMLPISKNNLIASLQIGTVGSITLLFSLLVNDSFNTKLKEIHKSKLILKIKDFKNGI